MPGLKVPLPFRVLQAIIITSGGTYLSSLLFPKDIEYILYDVADNLVVPLMKHMDPENAQQLVLFIAKKMSLLCPKDTDFPDSILKTSLWDLTFSSPIGLAAGLDKDGEIVGPLLNFGFGFVEVGTVTPKPQPGNDRPRIFRLDRDEAIISRCGFDSNGMGAVRRNLREFENRRCDYGDGILGINIGKNDITDKAEAGGDCAKVIERLGPTADYVVVNICPSSWSHERNDGRRFLREICEARDKAVEKRVKHVRNMSLLPSNARIKPKDGAIAKSNRPHYLPLLLKLSPDISQEELRLMLDDILSQRGEGNLSAIDGLVVCDSTCTRPNGLKSEPTVANQTGGLSGVPMKDISTKLVAEVFQYTKGQIPIIGVGGVNSGSDAFEKIAAGASLVQVYTMLCFKGPGSVRRLKADLSKILRESGFSSVEDAVGCQASTICSKSNST